MPVIHPSVDSALTEAPASSSATISLIFGNDVSGQVRSRMLYAFRVFAAIYNYTVVDAGTSSASFRCIYTHTQTRASESGSLIIPARYRACPLQPLAKALTKYRYANEDLYLAHGLDEATGNPDWLGEIFEWLSSSYEIAVTKRDSIGRIPYAETIFGQLGITPRKPYANTLMAWMEHALRNGNASQALPKAPSPIPSAEHIVLPSHDIDFYFTSKRSAFIRFLKNLGISLFLYRSSSFFVDNLRHLLRLSCGNRVGDYLPALIREIEQCGFRSTFFVVSRRGHRRDPNFDIGEITSCLVDAKDRGFSVALHGSYRSIIEDGTLSGEAHALANALGKQILGGRQHWLRFDLHDKLFREIEQAGLVFDSTLGFAETVGFRNGASFAYPPYDFEKEAPFPFLEFPLVLMDGGLEACCRDSGEKPQNVADEVLNESRKWGWGGVAVLWHDPMEPIQVPREINRVFWNCATKQGKFHEKWISSDQFLECCLLRYQNAGLLQSVAIRA